MMSISDIGKGNGGLGEDMRMGWTCSANKETIRNTVKCEVRDTRSWLHILRRIKKIIRKHGVYSRAGFVNELKGLS